ncbi:hypothetical protein SVIOM342S_02616 [Streptomyces violaceorubidus]
MAETDTLRVTDSSISRAWALRSSVARARRRGGRCTLPARRTSSSTRTSLALAADRRASGISAAAEPTRRWPTISPGRTRSISGRTGLPGRFPDAQHGFARGGGQIREDVLDVASRHQRHHLAGGCRLGGQAAGHRPAVLEDGDPVADAADLLQAVRDVDDGDSVGGEVGDDAEKVVDLVRVERGGRLVHHDQPYVVRQRACHGHDLLLGRRQVADQPPRVDLRVPEPFEQRGRRRLGRLAPYDEAGGGRLVTEVDVLGDRQVFDQVEFLVDGGRCRGAWPRWASAG